MLLCKLGICFASCILFDSLLVEYGCVCVTSGVSFVVGCVVSCIDDGGI